MCIVYRNVRWATGIIKLAQIFHHLQCAIDGLVDVQTGKLVCYSYKLLLCELCGNIRSSVSADAQVRKILLTDIRRTVHTHFQRHRL